MTRISGALLAGILLAALTGCVPAADAAPPTSEPPSPTASAEPEPTVMAKPTLAFAGACEALVDDATLSDLVGDDMAIAVEKSERVWAVGVLGGLDCIWLSDSEAYVSLDVLPAAGLEAQVSRAGADSPYCYGGEPSESRCSFSTVIDGYWLSGIVGVANGSANTALDAIDAITERVADAASAAAPVSAARPDGTWSVPAECSTLADAVDTTGILGATFAAEQESVGGEVTSGFIAALHAVGDLSCTWATPDYARWFTSELLPGAGWAISELAARAGAAPVTVDGALQAVALPLGDGQTTAVYATDGVNLAWVTVPLEIDQTQAATLTSAVMAAASR
ncbi:hypothetical protein [Agromyces ramosus]|nr:hypothetical protein [Agromyces ramosus]